MITTSSARCLRRNRVKRAGKYVWKNQNWQIELKRLQGDNDAMQRKIREFMNKEIKEAMLKKKP